MRAKEFISETTTAGGIATVATPIGPMQSRMGGGSFFTGKYTADPYPNTPKRMKRKKRAS